MWQAYVDPPPSLPPSLALSFWIWRPLCGPLLAPPSPPPSPSGPLHLGVAGPYVDRYGGRSLLLLSLVSSVLCYSLTSAATNVTLLYLSR